MAEALAQFASPAKRRKMCFAADEAAGGLCSPDSKALPSRLKGKNATPKTPKHMDMSEPCTPGSKLAGAGMDDGLLAMSPEQLPASLMLLNQLLGALYVTMPLVRSRGKSTTYQNLRVPVQNFSGRDFQVRHIQQIKALCPEALDWEHVLATNASTKKQEQQLLLRMPSSSDKSRQGINTAQMQQLFYKRLQQHLQKHQAKSGDPQVPLAELPPLAGPNARDCTPNRRVITADMLPGTPQTAPPGGGVVSHTRGGSGSITPQNLLMSPPAKRPAVTCLKPVAGVAEGGLMSPPPGRTRSSKSRQSGAKEADEPAGAFTFSPMPRQPDQLMSPSAGGPLGKPTSLFGTPSRHHTPVRTRNETTAAGAADADAGSKTPLLRPNKLFGTPVTSTPQQTAVARRPTDTPAAATPAAAAEPAAAAGVKVRKLTFGAAASSSAAAAAGAGAGVSSSSSSVVVKAATKLGAIKFELGDSAMALLQKVSNAEAQREKAAHLQQLDQARALDMLPGTFDVLRAVFGERGPCVKPKSEVLLLLRQKSTCKAGMSPADTAEQLDLLMRFVPEFVRTIHSAGQSLAGGMVQSVRINRQMPWPAARSKLLAAAEQARSGGGAAAAEAVAAEEKREQAAAAAAAKAESEAAADDEEEESEDQDDEAELEVADDVVVGGAAAAGGDDLNVIDQALEQDILGQLATFSSNSGGTGGSRKAVGSSTRSGSKAGAKSLSAAEELEKMLGVCVSSNKAGSSGGQAATKSMSAADELEMMLGGGSSSKAGSKGSGAKGCAMNGAFLSALAFKAPAPKR